MGWSVYTSLFLFLLPRRNFIRVILAGMSSFRDEISSRQKRVNIKRHFAIDRDDFILRRVSSRDRISRVNTLLIMIWTYCNLAANSICSCVLTLLHWKMAIKIFLDLRAVNDQVMNIYLSSRTTGNVSNWNVHSIFHQFSSLFTIAKFKKNTWIWHAKRGVNYFSVVS